MVEKGRLVSDRGPSPPAFTAATYSKSSDPVMKKVNREARLATMDEP
jgi:hypothetical protein